MCIYIHVFRFERLRVCLQWHSAASNPQCLGLLIDLQKTGSPESTTAQTQGRPCHLFLSDEGRWGPKEKLKSYPWCCWLSCVYFIWLSVSPTIASDGEKWSLLGPWLKWKGISGALHIQWLLQPLIELMTCSNTLLSATCCAINNSSGNMADDLIHALSVFPPLSSSHRCPRLISCRVIDVK